MISTQTEHTKKVFSDFATYTVNKNKAMIYIYVCSAIIIACAITILVLGNITQGVLYLCLGVLFALYGLIVRFVIILANKKNIGTVDIYEFDDYKFTITVCNKEGKEIGVSTINYEALHSVKIYKNYAYIYINKVTAYILVKENFADENSFKNVVTNIQNNIVKKG